MAHNFRVMLSAVGVVKPQAWGGDERNLLRVGAGTVIKNTAGRMKVWRQA